MRVLHINCNYISSALHCQLIDELNNQGVHNVVFAPISSATIRRVTPSKNDVVAECFRKWDRICFDYKQSKIGKALDKALGEERFDLIHAYTLFTDGNTAMKRSLKTGEPYVVTVRNTDINAFLRWRPYLRPRAIKIMQNAKAVFFLSEAYRKTMFDKYVPERYRAELLAKSYIMPNGLAGFWSSNLRNDVEQPHLAAEKPLKLLYAGRIDRNKNIPTTQKAMAILRERGINSTLTVVGEAEDKQEYARIASDAFTDCLPATNEEGLLPIYRNHDIFVMPSFTETFGLVYLEAMSQGLPVVYTTGQGFDGQLPEGTVGYHVDPHSPQSVADAIQQIVARYAEIASAVPQLTRQFTWQGIAAKYITIYRRIVEG